MSHALLLRLFLSPYFSISVAMHYLKTYPDNIGISHYLCWRMKSMPFEEVEFYWPQICHLLITRPTSSNALESFVVQRAGESTHVAMLTFWFMQSALHDLTPTRVTNPRSFHVCQRVLHRVHEIIFGDPPEPNRSPYRSLPHSPHSSNPNVVFGQTSSTLLKASPPEPLAPPVRVNPHAAAALVGMGVMMAGPGMPGLRDLVGEWAVMQGQRPIDDEQEMRARVEVDQFGGADGPRGRHWDPKIAAMRRENGGLDSDDSEDDSAPQRNGSVSSGRALANRQSRLLPDSMTPPVVSTHVHQGAPRAEQAELTEPPVPQIHNAQPPSDQPHGPFPNESTPVFPSLPVGQRGRGRDPFSQSPSLSGPLGFGLPPSTPSNHQPYHSVPDLSSAGTSNRRTISGRVATPSPEALLAAYSYSSQRELLRLHYCRSEIRFLTLLEDISNRLLVIPKPARISALRAELTSLNHNLPAEVCMPLWCNADHHARPTNTTEQTATTTSGMPILRRSDKKGRRAHSRVVRISPGDSVVLNSAERAPYLLHVEILEDDLDFDPSRRENRELLKKIVVQEDIKRRKRENGESTSGIAPLNEGFGALSFNAAAPPPPVVAIEDESQTASPRPSSPTTETEDKKVLVPEEAEEMDLVEQLYGNQLSVRDSLPDLSESLPLPSAPKNKQLDLEVWNSGADQSRRSSLGGLPFGYSNSPGTGSPNGGSLGVESPGMRPSTPVSPLAMNFDENRTGSPALATPRRTITLDDYSERMRTAAVMLAQLNASQVHLKEEPQAPSGPLRWIPGTGWITGSSRDASQSNDPVAAGQPAHGSGGKLRLAAAQAAAIRERIMEEMMALEEERVSRMTAPPEDGVDLSGASGAGKTAEDEGIVRREINKADPSAAVFKESWAAKKTRIRASSPWGHLASWDVISVIVKTGADLRQEQLATQLIERFVRIWKEEKSDCWARFFRILITGDNSGLVETITDAVSVHSIKKSEYARRLAEGSPIGHVSLMEHYVNTYGKPDSGAFARARRNFIKSLAGYSVITYLLQIKDRHNGNILVDRDGHLIHIDFGFMLSNSPGGNMGFEAAPFKLPMEYVEIMGGLDSPGFVYFRKLFKEGFEAARKHSDSLITIVELMQKDSKLDCFVLFGENTVNHFRDRFALGLTTQAVDAYLDRLIVSSTGSNYTRLYDTFQYYSQGVL